MERYTNGMPPKFGKEHIAQHMHLTRPPRLEGKVKEARMQPIRKSKKNSQPPQPNHKPQGPTDQQRKNYQLKSKRH